MAVDGNGCPTTRRSATRAGLPSHVAGQRCGLRGVGFELAQHRRRSSGRPGAAMLKRLELKNVGPAPELAIDFGERLNLLTGDNGL